jgi:hypothetical protein
LPFSVIVFYCQLWIAMFPLDCVLTAVSGHAKVTLCGLVPLPVADFAVGRKDWK